MIYIAKDVITVEDFIVVDESDNPVTGLVKNNFTIILYDPNGNSVADVSAGIEIIFEEIGSGLYRLSFTPNELGNWTLLVYNDTYFPFGKGENYTCLLAVGGVSPDLEDQLKRTIGLCQENYRIFEQGYDKNNNLTYSVIKLYANAADVENDMNPIATYEMLATYNLRNNKLTGYKVKRLS